MSNHEDAEWDDPLADHLPIIHRYLKPCIGFDIVGEPPKDRVTLGQSRFGGGPDVPTDFVWPRNRGVKLEFLMQLNLAELAPLDPSRILPESGVLSFFFDRTRADEPFDKINAKQARVFHFVSSRTLRRQPSPHPTIELEESALEFWDSWSLPSGGSEFAALFAELNDGWLDWGDDEEDAYAQLCDDVFQRNSPGKRSYSNRLGGYSTFSHGRMQIEAELASRGVSPHEYITLHRTSRATWTMTREDVLAWSLLLQLDAEHDLQLPGFDSLHYWIPDASADSVSLARAWATLQPYQETLLSREKDGLPDSDPANSE